MALRRGFGEGGTISGGEGFASGPKTFYVRSGQEGETTVVLLDDQPVECVRHQMFIKGDKKGNSLRQTCAGMDPQANAEPCPRECQVCNAALRYDRIARKHLLYLTVIDERAFTYEGKQYKDMKRLLELTKDDGDLFKRRAAANGGLVGARFKVYRSAKKNSARIGDDWTFLGFVHNRQAGEDPKLGLMRHFWESPAVLNKRKAAAEREGKQISHEDACRDLITPYNYEELMGTYKVSDAQAFVAYYEGAMGIASSSAGTASSPVPADGAPPMPGHMSGSYSGAPNYNAAPPMPASDAPSTIPPYPTAPPSAPPVPGSVPSMPPGYGQATMPGAPAGYAGAVPPATAPAPSFTPPPPAAPQPNYGSPPFAPPYNTAPGVPVPAPTPHAPPSVPDPTSAGGPGYNPPPFPGMVTPPSQQQAPTAPPAPPSGAPPFPGSNYDFGAPAAPPQPQPATPQAPAADPFPTA